MARYGTDPFDVVNTSMNGLMELVIAPLRIFNKCCYDIFQFGNIIMFLLFLLMGINLLIFSKDREYYERLHARNLEFLKKRGRIGTIICILLGIAFLVKEFIKLILLCLSPLPAPPIFQWLRIDDLYRSELTRKDIYSYNVIASALLFGICLISLASSVLIIVGIYSMCFNKSVFESKLKAFKLLAIGILLGIIVGLAPGFWLLL